MVDNLKPEDRHKAMKAVKGKGTKLEQRLFSMLAGMRLSGWYKNVNCITGKPDVVFEKERVLIFIDGCFWHGCPICKKKLPETNYKYWKHKIAHNIELAKRNNQHLKKDRWAVIRIWEHEMNNLAARQSIRRKIIKALTLKAKK